MRNAHRGDERPSSQRTVLQAMPQYSDTLSRIVSSMSLSYVAATCRSSAVWSSGRYEDDYKRLPAMGFLVTGNGRQVWIRGSKGHRRVLIQVIFTNGINDLHQLNPVGVCSPDYLYTAHPLASRSSIQRGNSRLLIQRRSSFSSRGRSASI